jgi:hypothetical protein
VRSTRRGIFSPQLRKHLSLLCLRSGARTSAFNDRGPTAQRGRDVIVPLVDSFLRDPFYIARGAVLLVILTWMSPVLGLFLFGGMALDGLITLVMEIRLNPLYQEIRKIELRINSLEYVLHDHEARDLSEDMELLWELRVAWDEFAVLTRTAETQRLIFQSVLREGVALLVRLGMMLLVGWWVHIGYATITEYIFFTTIVTRANDPLVVLLNLAASSDARTRRTVAVRHPLRSQASLRMTRSEPAPLVCGLQRYKLQGHG